MEIIIYPYKISQRTEYSKALLYDLKTGSNVTEGNKKLIDKIIEDYNMQRENPNFYFVEKNNRLTKLKKTAWEDDINFLFIPEGIKTIGKYVIENTGIKFVNFPSTLQKIDDGAFANCKQLKYIEIPDSVKKICWSAFYGCSSLENIKLPNIDIITAHLFAKCENLKEIVLPDSVKEIENDAFVSCKSLTNIKLPKKLKKISNNVFEDCIKLKKIDFPEGLKLIDFKAFDNCISLQEVVIPNSVDKINERVFKNCKDLKYVKLSDNMKIIPEELFMNCENLEKITLPDNIELLSSYIFSNTKKLKSINIPKNLHYFDDFPFANSSIETLIFTHNLNSLDTMASLVHLHNSNCDLISNTKINELIIDKSVITITPDAFKYSGSQITSINYLGSEDEFNNFKKNNKELFENCFTGLKTIKFEEKEKNKTIEEHTIYESGR